MPGLRPGPVRGWGDFISSVNEHHLVIVALILKDSGLIRLTV